MTTVDYTKYRAGRKSARRLPIRVCPKCGRKGERTFFLNAKGQRVERFTHKAEVRQVAGFAFLDVTDVCLFVNEEDKQTS